MENELHTCVQGPVCDVEIRIIDLEPTEGELVRVYYHIWCEHASCELVRENTAYCNRCFSDAITLEEAEAEF
jgi:hypothetical protein